MLLWIIAFSLLGSVGAVAGSASLLAFPDRVRKDLVPSLISYATGTLPGAAFLGMLPAALDQAPALTMTTTVLAGMVLFFVLEKLALWRHCHRGDCEVHSQAAPLILIGDAFHNFVDGALIAAAFLSSIPLGIAASLAVIAHEIPQESGTLPSSSRAATVEQGPLFSTDSLPSQRFPAPSSPTSGSRRCMGPYPSSWLSQPRASFISPPQTLFPVCTDR